jgi:maltooligosyltrehalose trehalohydrolase
MSHRQKHKGSTVTPLDDFTVWAPLAKKVNLHIVHPIDEVHAMKKNDAGFFSKVMKGTKAGTRYYYSVDGGKDLPDPASHYQPEGVAGPSQKVDHSQFQWSDEHWRGLEMRHLIIYELHVGTFTSQGTFDAIIPRLKDLADLGVNAIEIMPISQFPGDRNWGYDGVFPYAVQNSYGGPDGFKRLVNACHLSGIAVILDVVYNHFGPEGNVFPQFGPYLTDAYHVPWGQAVNFDQQWSDGVRDFVLDNVRLWYVDYHVDGLRLDAIHAIHDSNGRHILLEINERKEKLQKEMARRLFTIAESDLNDAKVVRHPSIGGYNFDAQWLDDFHHALYVLIHPPGLVYYSDFGKIEQLAKALSHGFVFTGEYVSFRKRRFGSPSGDVPHERFIVFSQNHDQVGNRIDGERLSKLVNVRGVKLAAAALILSPYIPMLFMGEEYADPSPFVYFISHSDPELVKAVREGRKKEFAAFHHGKVPPDAADPETFRRCVLRWDARGSGKHSAILQWHKKLITLRKTHPAFANPAKTSIQISIVSPKALLLIREDVSGVNRIGCLFNFSNSDITIHLAHLDWHILEDSSGSERKTGQKRLIRGGRVTARGVSAVVFEALPARERT